jgi:Coenzyme PQQ synthesis protein D (PqqD)
MAARRVENVQTERAADALNQSATAVYDLCDGETSKSEMAAEIHRRTGLPADEEIVDLALAELVETGLVVLDDPGPRSSATRRSLIRRLALSSTLVLMLPVVETIVVPSAEAATPITPIHAPTPAPTPTPTPTER